MVQMVSTETELHSALSDHSGRTVLVFKHSTQCPISAEAFRQVQAFEKSGTTPVYLIRVIEERPLSLSFAEQFHVAHQSPQAIAIKDGLVVWHASHYDITASSLERAVQA